MCRMTVPNLTELDVTIAEGPSCTVAEVEWFGFTATGEARRSPDDEHDPLTGRVLATGRALEALSEELVRFSIQRSAKHH